MNALADPDLAGADVVQPGDHPERRRLAAARRPDQDQKLAVLDLEPMSWTATTSP
jgi:hypothetical protein